MTRQSLVAALALSSAALLLTGDRRAIADAPPASSPAPLKMELAGAPVVSPGTSLAERLILTNTLDKPQPAVVEFSVQHDGALFDRRPPDPVYGSDRALGARSWTEAEGKTIERGSLTDGKSWTSAETEYITDHYTEAFQYIDLGVARHVLRMTWDSGDANWVAKVDVSASTDGRTYVPVPSLQRVDLYKKWGTNAFPLTQPFDARYIRFRYHNDGAKANVIRMPTAISVYDGVAGDSTDLPQVGRAVAGGRLTTVVPAHGAAVLRLTGKTALTPGAYLVAVRLQSGSRKSLDWQHVMVMPKPLTPSAQSRFGLDAADPALIGTLQKLGVGWVRFENLKWPFVSNVKGVFDFSGTIAPPRVDEDAIMESYRAHGISVLPFLFLTQNYETPPGTSPPSDKLTDPPKDFSAYADFAYQAVARYGATKHPAQDLETQDKKSDLGLIHVFEIWNEPNLNNPDWGEWKGTLPQYYDLFRQAAESVKKADPTALVSNGGFSGIGVQLVDSLRTYKYPDGKCPLDFMNVLNVHYYTGRSAPETARVNANTGTFGSVDQHSFAENLALLREWRDRNKPGLPIWLTETGYETNADFGVDEYTQAAWLPRDVMICLANGVDKVMVFRESGSDSERWGSAGVLRTDGSPKPSFFTYGALIRELDGVKGGALPIATGDSNVRIYAWKQAGKPLLTAWAVTGTALFPLKLGKATVADSFGDHQSAVDTVGLKLSIFPIYIRDCSDPRALAAVLAKAERAEAQRRETQRRQEALKASLFGFGSPDDVGGFVIGQFRKSTPVVATDTYDPARGYGFAPTAALQDDQVWINDGLNQHACRLAKGIQFRWTPAAGKYLLNVGVVPFDPVGHLTVSGAAGGPKTVEVRKEQGIAQIKVEATGAPLSIEMDGYASLRWVKMVQD